MGSNLKISYVNWATGNFTAHNGKVSYNGQFWAGLNFLPHCMYNISHSDAKRNTGLKIRLSTMYLSENCYKKKFSGKPVRAGYYFVPTDPVEKESIFDE